MPKKNGEYSHQKDTIVISKCSRNENIVFLGKGTTRHNHHFLVMAEKRRESWDKISSITHQLSRRQFKMDICTSVYKEWCDKSSSHHFALTKEKILLKESDAVKNLMVTLANLFAKKLVIIYILVLHSLIMLDQTMGMAILFMASLCGCPISLYLTTKGLSMKELVLIMTSCFIK